MLTTASDKKLSAITCAISLALRQGRIMAGRLLQRITRVVLGTWFYLKHIAQLIRKQIGYGWLSLWETTTARVTFCH
ncbi:Uncharacterised protein [Vibrio cholerae]|nr:Uncharacterised protein [Vibrio cholerae]CSB29156.1 Uncharacterised protein [Vibrio cholerae]